MVLKFCSCIRRDQTKCSRDSQAVGVPVLQAPRIGSAQQLGLVYSEPGSYNLNYFVEEHGYIGYFVYAGPVSGDGAMEVAVKKFS